MLLISREYPLLIARTGKSVTKVFSGLFPQQALAQHWQWKMMGHVFLVWDHLIYTCLKQLSLALGGLLLTGKVPSRRGVVSHPRVALCQGLLNQEGLFGITAPKRGVYPSRGGMEAGT